MLTNLATAAAGAAAGASVVALPALAAASQPDPIYAAIEAHKAATAHIRKILDEQNAMEESLPEERLQSIINAIEEEIAPGDPPEWIPQPAGPLFFFYARGHARTRDPL